LIINSYVIIFLPTTVEDRIKFGEILLFDKDGVKTGICGRSKGCQGLGVRVIPPEGQQKPNKIAHNNMIQPTFDS
ncbi:MAG: hypothetical protein ACE5NG_16445, partial [bacterium]